MSEKFEKSVDYDFVLEKLKGEFEKRWNTNSVSPDNNLQNYESLCFLGQGAFGKVRLVRDKQDSVELIAVKEMSKDSIVKQKQVEHIFNEKKVLQSVRFPFLVHLIFSSKDFENLYLGMTFCPGGDLFGYHRKVQKFNERVARFYAVQVFLGLEYLHSLYLLYRDLKPENILIDAKGYLKLADYGFVKRCETRTYEFCGTPEYIAPEIILTKPYGVSVDWWAFGVLLFEFVQGSTPFVTANSMALYEKIVNCEFSVPSSFSPPFVNLIKSFLTVDTTKRLGCFGEGMKEIRNHEWFAKVDWYSYLNQDLPAPYVPKSKKNEEYTAQISAKPMKVTTNKHKELFENF